MRNKKEIEFERLVRAYGYEQIDSNNKYMWSYFNKDSKVRINYYYSTGTLTAQSPTFPIKVYKELFTTNYFESVLEEVK